MNNEYLAIDIGSTKVCAIVATYKYDNKSPQIIGQGISKARGFKKGIITNIEHASASIKKAVDDAKVITGSQLSSAIVSLSGSYTKGATSHGIVNITSGEITIKEINRAVNAALYNASLINEHEVIHVLPYKFKVDEHDYIEDPLGMSGQRLEAFVYVITAQKSVLGNLNKVLHNAGVEVSTYVHSGYAADIAVVNSDEKELGVAVVDIGGSVCNVVIHVNNAICYSDVLSVGSGNITSDISIALHTPLKTAENIKLNYGSLLVNHDNNSQSIDIPKIGDENYAQSISLDVIQKIIYARVEETFVLLKKMIEKSNFSEDIGAGIILTGGASKLNGMKELASLVFDNMPVRIAKPKEVDGLFDSLRNPAFTSAVGLVLYGADGYTKYEIDSNKRIKYNHQLNTTKVNKDNSFSNLLSDIQDEQNEQDKDMDTKITKLEDDNDDNKIVVSKKNTKNSLLSRISNSVKHFF